MNKQQQCFYCARFTRNPEQDHAPVPKRHGGTTTVVACQHCHNLKDRLNPSSWSPAELDGLKRGSTRLSECVLGACLAAAQGQDIVLNEGSMLRAAATCSTPEARIAVFKTFAFALDATSGACLSERNPAGAS